MQFFIQNFRLQLVLDYCNNIVQKYDTLIKIPRLLLCISTNYYANQGYDFLPMRGIVVV